MKLNFEKPVVGQKVTVVEHGNRLRYRADRKPELFEGEVTKVGRKYFTISVITGGYAREVEFNLENWYQKTEYTANYRAVPSKEDYLEEQARHRWASVFRDTFSGIFRKPFTLEQYEAAGAALGLELSAKS